MNCLIFQIIYTLKTLDFTSNANFFFKLQVVGGSAEVNGQLMRGDQIMSVNDSDLSNAKQDQAVALLKTASGTVKIKIRRYKCVASNS